jgi:methylmalonyl-CoA/ethylmalonyl-CoA epimerase
MQQIKRIHHIALLVEDIDSSLGFWRGLLGIQPSHVSDFPQEAARIAFLSLGECEVELVQPTSSDSGLSRFLASHGPGMHHLCLEVSDLERLLVQLKENHVQLINDQPKLGDDGRFYAFIHPKSTNGVLLELYQLPSLK